MDEEKVLNHLVNTTKSSVASRPNSLASSFRIDQPKTDPSNGNNVNTGNDLVTVPQILDDVDLSDVSLRSMSKLSDAIHTPHLKGKNKAYIIFFILGIGSLLPWNAFITSSSYYQTRFCGTAYENTFESFFSMLYTVSGPIGLSITIIYQDHLSIRSLVLYPLLIYSAVFLMITSFIGITSMSADLVFGLTLISIGGCGVSAALMSGGLFGLAGLLPSFFTGAIMNGQGLAGFSVSVVSLLIATSTTTERYCSDDGSTDDENNCSYSSISYGALAFYIASCMTLILCVILFIILLKLEYVEYFIKLYYKERLEMLSNQQIQVENPMQATGQAQSSSVRSPTNASESNSVHSTAGFEKSTEGAGGGGPVLVEKYAKSSSRSMFSPDMITALIDDIGRAEIPPNNLEEGIRRPLSSSNLSRSYNYSNSVPGTPVIPNSNSKPSKLSLHSIPDLSHHSIAAVLHNKSIVQSSAPEIKLILKRIQIPAYSVFITFCGTLTVFPSLMVLIQSQSPCESKYNSLFISILFTIYNISDFTGRNSAVFVFPNRQYIDERNIWIYANLRLIFPLLLCFCNITNTRLPILFGYDIIVILLLTCIGLSNGLVANLSMMYGPTLVESESSALAGTIMVFCLSLGLLVGSCFSFLVLFIVIGND